MCGRDLLRLPGVNPGQHRNGLQPVPHTFWLLAERMHKEQGKKGCLGTNPLLADDPFDRLSDLPVCSLNHASSSSSVFHASFSAFVSSSVPTA